MKRLKPVLIDELTVF